MHTKKPQQNSPIVAQHIQSHVILTTGRTIPI